MQLGRAVIVLASATALAGCMATPLSQIAQTQAPAPGAALVRATARGHPDERGPATSTTPRPGPSTAAPASWPPQFVVVSFDGAGNTALFTHWREVAQQTSAHLTFFLSGLYLLPASERTRYVGPRHAPGVSDIGLFSRAHVQQLVAQLTAAFHEGNEIGTHYNGHFCLGRPGNVTTWNTVDWNNELDQFDDFVRNVAINAGLPPGTALPFGPAEVIGGRTPCLQGSTDALFPALRAHGFRYDASGTGLPDRWPAKIGGLWEFPLQSIPVIGTGRTELSMDYNLYYLQSGGRPGPADTFAADRAQTLPRTAPPWTAISPATERHCSLAIISRTGTAVPTPPR